MLHMIVATHGPETCAASVSEIRDRYVPPFNTLHELAAKLGVSVEGEWVDMSGHTIFIVVEAPNAHVVQQLTMDTRLMDWNTVRVHPVVPRPEAMKTAAERKL